MKRKWKLWPRDYEYRFHKIIWGIGFDLFMAVFVFTSINKDTKFYINSKEVTYTEFLIPVSVILLLGLFVTMLGVIKNRKVYQLRKELKTLKDNFQCYDGTISSVERIQVNDVVKSQADNIQNKHTYVVNRVVVDYIDEDGRKRIATSEEYGEYLSVFLKDNIAKIYVSKNGNNRIIDNLSWRQSAKDAYIEVPGGEMKEIIKKIYYHLVRWRAKIEIGTMLTAFAVIIILLIR